MLKFGIIGTSWITNTYVDGALQSGLWEFTGIYSRSLERGLEFGEKYGVTNVFTDIDEFANSKDIDAIYIASPNHLHVHHAKIFIKAGKHVICEKPLTAHYQDVLELQRLAKENNVIFLEAIMFMHLPKRDILLESLDKIGNVSYAKFDFCQRSSKYDSYLNGNLPNIFNPEMETGGLMDLGVYCLYPALYFFGEPNSINVNTLMMKSGVDSSGSITFKYSDKILQITYSKIGQASANSEIQGDFGTIEIESISKLENIRILYSNGNIETLAETYDKHILMGYESIDFYKYITDLESNKEEYEKCSEMSVLVAKYLEDIRKIGGVIFPSDEIYKI